MSVMSPGDLATIRSAMLASFPSTSTNSRTTDTRTCRIWAEKRSYHLPGLPPYMRIPVWHIALPDGDTVATGDTETSPGNGSYIVSEVLNPADDSVATDVLAARIADASGNIVLPFAKNADIRFKRPLTAETTALLPVFIRRADQMTDPRREDGTPAYEWHMTYPLAAAYVSDATKPGVNHYILWSEFPGVEPTIAEQPDRVTNQFFGLASLCFNTTG